MRQISVVHSCQIKFASHSLALVSSYRNLQLTPVSPRSEDFSAEARSDAGECCVLDSRQMTRKHYSKSSDEYDDPSTDDSSRGSDSPDSDSDSAGSSASDQSRHREKRRRHDDDDDDQEALIGASESRVQMETIRS